MYVQFNMQLVTSPLIALNINIRKLLGSPGGQHWRSRSWGRLKLFKHTLVLLELPLSIKDARVNCNCATDLAQINVKLSE